MQIWVVSLDEVLNASIDPPSMGYAQRGKSLQKLRAVGSMCYLCAKPLLTVDEIDRDHVPAKSYFPSRIRAQHNPNLDVLWVHRSCNKAIAWDEEYFRSSVGPMAASDDHVGQALVDDLTDRYRSDPRTRALGLMAIEEFSRIRTADGLMLKRVDTSRSDRVLWKIARGLAFLDTRGRLVVPPETPHKVFLLPTPEELAHRPQPDWLSEMLHLEPMGRYGRVLDYRALTLLDYDVDARLRQISQAWAILLWNRIIAGVFFHVPWCPCDKCVSFRANQDTTST